MTINIYNVWVEKQKRWSWWIRLQLTCFVLSCGRIITLCVWSGYLMLIMIDLWSCVTPLVVVQGYCRMADVYRKYVSDTQLSSSASHDHSLTLDPAVAAPCEVSQCSHHSAFHLFTSLACLHLNCLH